MASVMAVPTLEIAKMELFSKSLPYPVVATNVAGAYATSGIPEGLDVNTAGRVTLLRHGIPYRRPDAKDRPAVQAAWQNTYGRRHPFQMIIPHLEPLPAVWHKTGKVGKEVQAHTDFPQQAWAGGVFAATAATGPWTSATGNWTVQTVSKPSEPASSRNQWECSTWVGIDGFTGGTYNGTTDVLQAGVYQAVHQDGSTVCLPWFEWYVPSPVQGGVTSISQTTVLGDTTPFSPSMATVNNRLYLAWKGDGNDQMYVRVSNDGTTFAGQPLATGDTTAAAPAICEMNGNLYLAWKGDGNDSLNVAQVALDGNGVPTGLVNKATLGDTSPSGPTICSLDGQLYLGWRGEGQDQICVIQSGDGMNWANQLVTGETTPASPSMTACNGMLLLAWRGDGNDQLNVGALALNAAKAPTGLSQKTVLGITSPQNPSLAGLNGFLYLSFTGDNGNELYVFVSEDGGDTFSVGHSSSETSQNGPAMTALNGQMFLSWRGLNNNNLNVAPILTNFNEAAYRNPMTITNFPVKPGDYVTASITYVSTSSGMVQLSNNTTGLAFSLTLAPPAGANFSGQCVEWIVEAPGGGEAVTSLPSFTPVDFVQAFGCTAGDKSVANPQSGDTANITSTTGTTLTAVVLGSDAVTISFIG